MLITRLSMLKSLLWAAAFTAKAADPSTEVLWPAGAPGAVGKEDLDIPALTTYLPEKPNGSAILICPGGGYAHLAVDHEGKQIADWFNNLGFTAFVLKYRLGPRYHFPAPFDDAVQAMKMIRAKASQLNFDPKKVGIIGFSAGGHLASTVSTHAPAEARPNFAILCYPVISMKPPYAHKGSILNLLGENPDPAKVDDLSNQLRVTADTPPTFLFHTDDDPVVPVENSLLYYQGLKAAKVPAEMHIYAHGRHGVGLAQNDPVLSTWPARLMDWLRSRGVLQ